MSTYDIQLETQRDPYISSAVCNFCVCFGADEHVLITQQILWCRVQSLNFRKLELQTEVKISTFEELIEG